MFKVSCLQRCDVFAFSVSWVPKNMRLYEDLFQRDVEKFAAKASNLQKKIVAMFSFNALTCCNSSALIPPLQVGVYVAGFPCKAFSALRHMSGWLQDEQAKQFYGVVNNIRVVQPPAL